MLKSLAGQAVLIILPVSAFHHTAHGLVLLHLPQSVHFQNTMDDLQKWVGSRLRNCREDIKILQMERGSILQPLTQRARQWKSRAVVAIRLITQEPVQELTHPLSSQTNYCPKKWVSIETVSCLTLGKPGAVNRAKIHLSIVPTMAHCYQCFPVLQSGNTG